MASKRQARKKACTGKARYLNQDAAKSAATALAQDKQQLVVRAYKCPYCKAWHIGRKRIRR